jgi:adenylate cyclase class 1
MWANPSPQSGSGASGASLPLTAVSLSTLRKRFETLNERRLQRLEGALTTRQQRAVRVLPLLFHTNHPSMPGFTSRDVPSGIARYSPRPEALAEAARLAKSFRYRRRPPHEATLEALFVMGSPGTIAYSDKSDFDVWLCHRPELPAGAVRGLREKASRIKAWAASVRLEMHFFVMTAEAVRAGRHDALSAESSGTAQRHLLLDEFYRTALLLAGRHPLWWLVPPEREHEYTELAAELTTSGLVRPEDVIDFGGLANIPASEFFGATLWQLYKGISSPHKSLLKILLLEAYASEFPNIQLISQIQKQAIHTGEMDPETLDPYRLMMEKVEDYLAHCRDPERLELAHRSFYIKTNQRLSKGGDAAGPSALWDLTRRWGWDHAHLETLDARDQWRVEQVLDERWMLVNALTRSYRFLSSFVRGKTNLAAISPDEMNILGRRLFAAFERRAGKVELIGNGFGQNLAEDQLAVRRHPKGGQDTWLLFRGAGPLGAEPTAAPVRRAHTLVELLAWCHFNGITGPRTRFALPASAGPPSSVEIDAILRALHRHFPMKDLTEPSVDALALASRPVRALLIVNAGIDPLGELTRHGRHLTSARIDPLNYGSQQENLAVSFDFVVLTSWREVFAFRFAGIEGLMGCLASHLQHACRHPIPVSVCCFSADRGRTIANRVEQVFNHAVAALSEGRHRDNARYILKGGGQRYVLYHSEDGPAYQRTGGETELMRHLAQPRPAFGPVVFDRQCENDSPVPGMYRLSNPGVIQVFLQLSGREADLYIIDERGSLFHDRVPYYNRETLLNQYSRFLNAVLYRENAAATGRAIADSSSPLQFYLLVKGRDSRLTPKRLDHRQSPESIRYVQLQVISEVVAGEVEFTLYCDGKEFSTLEHGKTLFEAVANHVLDLRASRADYPIYITDIDLSGMARAGETSGTPQTIHYLNCKRHLEKRLNEALARVRPG